MGRIFVSILAAMVMVLTTLGTQVSAHANDLPVDPDAEVEADSVLTDDPLIPDTVDLPPEFQVAGTTSFAYGPDGSRTYFDAPSVSAAANWDSICGNGKSRYSVVDDYTRSGKHSRFERSYARMYCGKKDRTSATPHSEAAFGLRHVRAYHRSQFAKLASWQGLSWGTWANWAIENTLRSPVWRTVQSSTRFCYEGRFGFRNPSGSVVNRRVIVILGKTGVRIMTSFPRKDTVYCQGKGF